MSYSFIYIALLSTLFSCSIFPNPNYLNSLSAYGSTRNESISFASFNSLNPALINFTDTFEYGLTLQYDNTILNVSKIIPSSASLVFSNKYKFAVNYSNIFSHSDEIPETSIMYPSGTGVLIDVYTGFNTYSLTVGNKVSFLNRSVYYGVRLNSYTYKTSISNYEITLKGTGFSYGVLAEFGNTHIGFRFQPTLDIDSPEGPNPPTVIDENNLSENPSNKSSHIYTLPANFGFGLNADLFTDYKFYFDYNKTSNKGCVFHRNDVVELGLGLRFIYEENLLFSAGLFSGSTYSSPYFTTGFAYEPATVLYDFAYAFNRSDGHILKLTLSQSF